MVDLPSPRAFVGRQRELAEIDASLRDALAGRSRLVMIVGEPGIGKTRLAEQGADLAAAHGAQVAWGRCAEGGGAPAYWPWIQIVRIVSRDPAAADWLRQIGPAAARVVQLFPELRERVPELPATQSSAGLDAEQARFALFDATVAFLSRVASDRPLVLVLDDLHAADDPSFRLLEFLARDLRMARILVIGTSREIEAERAPESARLLNAIVRYGTRLPLSGLSEADVESFIHARFGLSASPSLTTAVRRLTDGNPFFVDEVVRMLRAHGGSGLPEAIVAGDLRIPPGVREATRERLRPLAARCHHTLALAAVIGREFDLVCLQEVAGGNAKPLLDDLHEAEKVGIIAELRPIFGRYTFTHGLIREVLYEDLPPAERMRLHAGIGAFLERLHAVDVESHLDEIAHHFLSAAPAGCADQAATYALRAGQRAAGLLAYEEAEACFQRGLRAATFSRAPNETVALQLLLALGEVQARRAASAAARETFIRAAELARQHPEPEHLARAALGLADSRGLGVPSGPPDPVIVGLIDEALGRLPNEDTTIGARLLARLASERCLAEEREQSVALSETAVEMARRLNDPATLALALSARHFVLWRLNHPTDRLGIVSELLQLAEGIGDQDLAAQGRTWRLIDLMTIGDVRAFDRELEVYSAFAENLRRPRYAWLTANFRAMRAIWGGRWEDAESAAQEAARLGERTGDPGALINPWVQMFAIRREQGRVAEEEEKTKFFVERFPANPVPPTFLALIYCELGRDADACEVFERIAAEGFADIRRERRTGLLPYLTEVCARLRDGARAELLIALLLPHARANLSYGPSICFGATTYYLGLLAASLRRWDEAVEYFEDALACHTRMDSEPLLARTLCDYAGALLDRGESDDFQRASDLLARAVDIAGELGMIAVSARAADLGRRLADAIEQEAAGRQSERTRAYATGAGGQANEGGQEPASQLGDRRGNGGSGAQVLHFPRRREHGAAHRDGQMAATGPGRIEARGHRRDAAARQGPGCHLFRLDGEFWTVGREAAPLRLKNSVGLRYLALLLQHPGREFHALDLVTGEPADASMTTPRAAGDPGDARLDPQARAAYRRRLEDLREQLEEATRFNDVGRAGRLREEIDFLAAELAGAVGLHGRDRSGQRHAERARISVTRVIKSAIKRVAEKDRDLGLYLRTTIKTGTFCSYAPDPRFPIEWTW